MATPRKPTAKASRSKAKAAADESSQRRIPPIKVLISSRNNDHIPAKSGGTVSLLSVRQDLWRELEGETLCGQTLLKVWINEKAGGLTGGVDIWEDCRKALQDNHVVVVIFNGEAGWSFKDRGNGICYEEVKYTHDHFPSKLCLIDVSRAYASVRPAEAGPIDAKREKRNRDFADFITDLQFWMKEASDDESLKEQVRVAVADKVSELAIAGSRGRKGRYYFGSPLDWSRLSYQERKRQLEATVVEVLDTQYGLELLPLRTDDEDETRGMVWKVPGGQLLLLVHGVPSSFSIAEARELVGRPYLFDHTSLAAEDGGDLAGPIHVIACHKSCTESQIFSFMGHPDVYIVQAPFGFFAADLSSFAQTFFLTDCRDRSDTSWGIKEMFDWIAKAGEQTAVVARAQSRQRILQAVRAEIDSYT
jgi:hypothetical protein